ncbi:MAG: hypothetical protein J6M39_05080 [Lachnospiraceae bacterium]|nr:hypothetical protein [Lachnospiraceae bacterium]
MKNKKIVFITIFVVFLVIVIIGVLMIKNNSVYDINKPIINYDLNNNKRDDYIEYLKKFIQPEKLREYIYNDYITFSQYTDSATGHTIKNQMEFKAYKSLFTSMFDKERKDYDDCPVTDNFKKKFDKNLLYYFNLNESEDCGSMCSLNRKDKEIIVEVYGNFKNTEPTYWTTHHFHYTLDDEGNVDDIVFDHTDK